VVVRRTFSRDAPITIARLVHPGRATACKGSSSHDPHDGLEPRRPAQTWRNGGGSTRELLAWPEAGAWQLRISVAEITRDGPFSAFAGVQRWFAVLRGDGVRLRLGETAQC
jgi:environmental stress-induced protein Ves